jgi:hypothetical protein
VVYGGAAGGRWLLFSGDETVGKVYVEDQGTTDASGAYSGTSVPFIVTTPVVYGPYMDWGVYKASLRHTNAGGSETISVAWLTGRDQSGTQQTTTKTVSLVTERGTDFFVGRAGEWAKVTLTHTAGATFGIQDIRADLMKFGRSGRVA